MNRNRQTHPLARHQAALMLGGIGLALLLLAGPSIAEHDDSPSDSASSSSTAWDTQSHITVGTISQFETDFDDDGSFEVYGGFGEIDVAIRLEDGIRIRTIGSYYGVGYDFGDEPTIAGSQFKPWNTIHSARLNPLLEVDVAEGWSVFGGPLLEAALENGGDLSNGLKPGGLLGAQYVASPTLRFGFGILGVAEIEDDFYLQPLLLLEWTPIEDLTISAESWTTRGGRIEIAYRPMEQLEIAPSLSYRRERFRLKERTLSTSPPPTVYRTGSKGVGEDRAVIPAVRITYLPQIEFIHDTLGDLQIDLEAGVALAGDLTIESRNGNQIQTNNYDPAPTLSLRFTIPL